MTIHRIKITDAVGITSDSPGRVPTTTPQKLVCKFGDTDCSCPDSSKVWVDDTSLRSHDWSAITT